MRVLVCGGRRFGAVPSDRIWLDEVLNEFHALSPIHLVITGGAPGADELAEYWAGAHQITVLTYPAQWALYGRRAGPVRNQRMLEEGRPDHVIAFPGGAGTADCVRRVQRAKIPLTIHK
jgi:predicted Rossmann-fold nucleotide-binding protein